VNGLFGPDPSTATDPALAANFAINQWERRTANAVAVREDFSLQPGSGPLFALVARLVHQKGVDLVCETARQVVAAGGQIAIIGRGQPHLERRVSEVARRFRGQVSARIGFAEDVARRMFAGSDFLLMPSRFEPCGLSQLYAQTYGSLPIAHATGGLVDTIDDGVTGLLFDQATVPSLRPALQRAFRIYGEPRLLNAMRHAAMSQDHSWAGPCARYVALYDQMAPLRAEA